MAGLASTYIVLTTIQARAIYSSFLLMFSPFRKTPFDVFLWLNILFFFPINASPFFYFTRCCCLFPLGFDF
jgi:hypothetical protein